jgi:exodeoxyribonuclease III
VVRLITWNVARRVQALAAQAAALGAREPDVVALQEVTARTLPLWEAALATIGLPHVAATLGAADPARVPAGPRRTGVLLAARAALEPLPGLLPVPWPETAIAGRVDGIEVHTVHVPNAANGWVKVRTLEAVRAGLAAGAGPRVLCGDLNTPRREHPDGSVISFARDTRERLRPERGT